MSINVSFGTGKTETTPKNNDRKTVCQNSCFYFEYFTNCFFINKVITCSAIRKFLVYQYLTSKQKCNSDD